jgi:hypothetical protein
MVRGIVGNGKTANPMPPSKPTTCKINYKKREPQRFMNIGGDEAFIVNFDKLEKRTYIYGQEISWDCPFKIIVGAREIGALIALLGDAKIALDDGITTRVEVIENFVVEVLGDQRLVALYKKSFTEGRFTLMFNQKELELIIKLLKKSYDLCR